METYVLGSVKIHPAAESVVDKRLEEMVFDTARAALDDEASPGTYRPRYDRGLR